MTDFNYVLTLVAGNTILIRRYVTTLPVLTTVVKAWFTVKVSKTDAYAAAIIAKTITGALTASGQIVADGSTPPAELQFKLTAADTLLLTRRGREAYVFDVQVKMNGGEVYTLEDGTVTVVGKVTDQIT